jgi:phosphoribosylanthranilate isomerase
MLTRIKICCISSVEEARTATRAGAHALGLVSSMPSGPGVIEEATIAEIAATTPPPVASFLLTSRQSPSAIAEQHRQCRTTAVQLVDRIDPDDYASLRSLLPGVKLVQVVHVTGPAAVDEAEAVAPHVDAVLLDSGRPDAGDGDAEATDAGDEASEDAPRELGGTGRTHDWSISREIVDRIDTPVFLAGGLDVTNVAEAVRTVRPFGVDVCTGVRTDGALDPHKLVGFIQAVHSVG